MKVSTKGRYALRMLVDLGKHTDQNSYIPLKDICEREQISKKYLEQIIPMLHHSEILDSVRGNKGGYRLKTAPSEITVYSILERTETELYVAPCAESKYLCNQYDECGVKDVWHGLNAVIKDYLEHITIQDIIDEETAEK